MAGTQERILDSAMGLIQSRGYSAISYQDISDEVGIRKASIHYYFPTKGDLAKAVVSRYREVVQEGIEVSFARRADDVWGMLDDYFDAYLSFEQEPDKICLCGSLAGEYLVLPEQAQREVNSFFADHLEWVRQIIVMLVEAGEVDAEIEQAEKLASFVLTSMQGALIIGRATERLDRVREAKEIVLMMLKGI